VAAGLQQRQHERGELMPERDRREMDAHVGATTAHLERRPARGLAVETGAHLRVQAGDLLQQRAHLLRGCAVVERGHQLHRGADALQVGRKLALDGGVQHGR
jgi:hypothetical protein